MSTKFEVIVVDNASQDGSVQAIHKQFPEINMIESSVNLGFTKGNNLGIKQSKGEYALLLNSDTEITLDSMDLLLEFVRNHNYGVVGCKLINPDNSFQPSGGNLPTFSPMFFWLSGIDDILRYVMPVSSYQERFYDFYQQNKIGWVSGAVMLISREVLNKVGLLDERIFMYGEDVDYCWRAKKAGFNIGWCEKAVVMHIGGASSKKPKLNQWLGEFKGLLYLYTKNYGFWATQFLKILIYLFVLLRVIVYSLLGRGEYAKTYATILKAI